MDQNDLDKIKAQEAEYEKQFIAVAAAVSENHHQTRRDAAEFVTPLGSRLAVLFNQYERERLDIEFRWLQDLRQVRGVYDPETQALMHPKRSKAFLSLTRTKVQANTSRMSDLLFPANGAKNWSIKPSPIPELNPVLIQQLVQQYAQQTGTAPDEAFIRKFINEEATRRATSMEKEMEDQLNEVRYRHTIREVIRSGNIYGTGVLKGPLVRQSVSKRWLPGQDGSWVSVQVTKIDPWLEFVPIWDIYPDMSARKIEDMRGIFQRYVMNRNKVFELSKRADFNKDAIITYLKSHPEGDADYKNFENFLRSMNPAGAETTGYKETTSAGTTSIGDGRGVVSRKGKYEVREFWGYVGIEELAEAGIEIDEEVMGLEVAVNIWLIGNVIIKAVIAPIEGVTFPYHFFYYEKDDSSIYGEGIPAVMRDGQKLFNAAVRAMLDNAAISAGPIIEANTDLLDVTEDPRDIYPFRVFLRDGQGQEATAPAIRVFDIKSNTDNYMKMIQFFMTVNDEITTIPRYQYGESNQVGGAGRTATGLSMLMGAANITLKDQIKNFDDGVTVPFIRALYFWNMEFNPKEHIKGDYSVHACGSTSLVAREVKAESLAQFVQMTNNPVDLLYLKRGNLLMQYSKILDLEEMDLVKDANTVQIEEQARAEEATEDKKFIRELAIMKATSGGHVQPSGNGSVTNNPGEQSMTPGMAGGGNLSV